MDLGGVNVTTANDATVRCIEDECAIDGVEIAEWKELLVGAREVSCCRDVRGMDVRPPRHDRRRQKLTFMSDKEPLVKAVKSVSIL